MADWNPDLYLRYAEERTRPALDLAARIPLQRAGSVLDIGCGPAVPLRWPRPVFRARGCSGRTAPPPWLDPETGRVFVFQSEGFWFDPAPFLAGHTTLPVYVQPGNYRRYAVDTAGIVPPEG